MLTKTRDLGYRIVHKPCKPAPLTPGEVVMRTTLFLLFFLPWVLLIPSYLWLIPGMLIGSALIVHPYCLITHRQHPPGKHWLF